MRFEYLDIIFVLVGQYCYALLHCINNNSNANYLFMCEIWKCFYLVLEPTFSRAPSFSNDAKGSMISRSEQSTFAMLCQAQAFPVPLIRYVVSHESHSQTDYEIMICVLVRLTKYFRIFDSIANWKFNPIRRNN